MKPGRLLVRFTAFSGFATGVLLIIAGLCTAILVPSSSGALASGAEGLAEGIGGAEDAVQVLGRDFEQSSSLFSLVSSSIRRTSCITGDTRTSLGLAGEAASELVSACILTAGDLENISSRLGSLIGPTDLRAAAAHLREAATSGAMAVESMDSLEVRLAGLESLLASVASSVDTLGADMAATRGTLEDAGSSLTSVRALAEKSSSAAFVSAAGILVGLALIILGLQQLVLSAMLLSHQPARAPSTCPSQQGAPGQS
jgi:hypothetical protein